MAKIGEGIFSILYLLFDLIAAIILFINANGNLTLTLFGWLTLILGGGDAFHLVPRIIKAFNEKADVEWWSGLGLMISSTTMTVFYIVLYFIWKSLFSFIEISPILTYALFISAGLRIILCLFPQNNWFSYAGNPIWGIYRNIPFVITGLCIIVLYALSGNTFDLHLWQISVAVFISFACYLPVVIWSKKYPAVGMLMIPKTLAYVWIIATGLSLIGKL